MVIHGPNLNFLGIREKIFTERMIMKVYVIILRLPFQRMKLPVFNQILKEA